MDEKKRMEELARKILETPARDWPGDLPALQVPLRPMPQALRSKLSELSRPQVLELKPKAARWKLAAGFSVGGAIAAGIIAYVGIFLQKAPDPWRGTIVFLTGSADLDGKALATGSVFREGKTMTVSSESLAVVSAISEGNEVQLRLRGPAQIGLDMMKPDHLGVRLTQGTVLGSLRHIGEQNQRNTPFSVSTATAIAGVRGTVFSTELSPGGDTTLSTYEGSVTFRRRWPELEELPEELITKMELLSQSRQVLIDASANVGADSQSTVEASDFVARIDQVRSLQTALEDPAVAKLRGKKTASPEEIKSALASLNSRFATSEVRASVLSSVKDAFGEAPAVKSVPSEEMQLRRNTLEGPDPQERDARFAQLLADKKNIDRETFQREATRVLGKPPQEIKLKNGETIYGSVFGLNDQYRIYTPSGIRDVSPEEVEEIQF